MQFQVIGLPVQRDVEQDTEQEQNSILDLVTRDKNDAYDGFFDYDDTFDNNAYVHETV